MSQFLIDLEKRSWYLNIHFRDQGLHKRHLQIRKFNIFSLLVVFFSKWPPEYTCFNISLANSPRKKILGV